MAIAKVRVLRKRPRLLITESVEEFETLRTSFRNEIEPRNAIERLCTAHFADGERRFHAMVSRHFARS
jgi:hypothetical protein